MKKPCTICDEQSLDSDEQLEQELEQYMESLPDEVKIDSVSYNERLKICETCQFQRQGLCGYCGCFVRVRAIKKNMYCPCPGEKKW